MKKLTLNIIQRFSIISVLSNYNFKDISMYNRALKISERVELTPEEKSKIHLKENREDGTLSWGKDAEGNPIEGFKDIEAEIELSDEMGDMLKDVIEEKIKGGIKLANIMDRASVEVKDQLSDPKRST